MNKLLLQEIYKISKVIDDLYELRKENKLTGEDFNIILKGLQSIKNSLQKQVDTDYIIIAVNESFGFYKNRRVI